MIEGETKTKAGELFGSIPLISEMYIGDFPVISTYSPQSATGGNHSVYIHDGKSYEQVSMLYLTGKSVDTLIERIRAQFQLIKGNGTNQQGK